MLYAGGCDTCYIQEVVIQVIYRRLYTFYGGGCDTCYTCYRRL